MKRKLIPREMLLPLIVLPIWQLAVFYWSRPLIAGLPHYDFTTAWDDAVPFLPWTVIIYGGAFPFWVVGCILCVRWDRDRAYRFLCADFLSKLVCLVTFILLPTCRVRPELTGDGLFMILMRIVYACDEPNQLLPSLHCSFSWMCWLGIREETRIPRPVRWFYCIFSLAIFVSTLTVKQHVLIDVFSGWLLAELCYRVCGHPGLYGTYRRLFDWLNRRLGLLSEADAPT